MTRPVALITGSSRGLGRAIALRFARDGWDVVVNAVRSVDGAASVAAEARALGADATVAIGDIADPATPDALVGAALDRWGHLDVLVNNAAITHDAPLLRLTEDDWDRLLCTDVFGPMALARRAAAAMGPGSSIVNIISLCGLAGCGGGAAYAAAKGALAGFTAGAATAFAERGVRINAVAPGYLPTDMGRAAPDAMAAAQARHAMGRLGDPAGAAAFIVALARMPHINGQVLTLDGRIR